MNNKKLMSALHCAIDLLSQTKDFQGMELCKFKKYTMKKFDLTDDEWYEVMNTGNGCE
jgi:hypothetical protein